VIEEGDSGIMHRSRGKASNRRISYETKKRVIKLYRDTYKGFGPTLASEKLLELDNINLSKETLRNWLIESGDWKKIRKGRKHRQWRERKRNVGQMVQLDGSEHDWFEGRGGNCVFMGYIDDATGKVFGRFYNYEGTIPAFDSFKGYARGNGLPLSVYSDMHTTYRSPAKPTIEDELNNTKPLSQFERAMKELGVEVIHARSPQAKGRIERLFRTLQDRLIKEMRLKGIKNIQEANNFLKSYLPIYNKKFSVEATSNVDLHRKIPKGLNLDSALCIKEKRVLRNDFTISYNSKLYQILNNIKAKKVLVCTRINGSMKIIFKDKILKYKEIKVRPLKKAKNSPPAKRRKYKPSSNHPWRKSNSSLYKEKDVIT